MAKLRVSMVHVPLNNLPRDRIVNTFYLDTDELATSPDYANLATDAANLWATYRPYPSSVARIDAVVYDMADAKPREPRAVIGAVPPNRTQTSGPREVALCLSFFSDRNLPSRRGRLYIGPWATTALDERPSPGTRDLLVALANGIRGLGGVNVDWTLYSPRTNTYRKITDYFIDDEWDTQRRRGLRSTARTVGTTTE